MKEGVMKVKDTILQEIKVQLELKSRILALR
jgi:hypothetical protein